MANTRQSTKRAKIEKKRTLKNQINRSSTKSAVRDAVAAIAKGDVKNAKEAYLDAVKALAKAASKGAIPAGRAARKISRLTLLAKKTKAEILASK
jgi:small subunit ribosomal protein S20